MSLKLAWISLYITRSPFNAVKADLDIEVSSQPVEEFQEM